jgi:hypothetical protein
VKKIVCGKVLLRVGQNPLKLLLAGLPLIFLHVDQAKKRPGVGIVLVNSENLGKGISGTGIVASLHRNASKAEIAVKVSWVILQEVTVRLLGLLILVSVLPNSGPIVLQRHQHGLTLIY